MAPVGSIPQICEPWPSCQTSVITPHAASTLSMLSTTALSGSRIERKARASSTKVTRPISAIISGKLP